MQNGTILRGYGSGWTEAAESRAGPLGILGVYLDSFFDVLPSGRSRERFHDLNVPRVYYSWRRKRSRTCKELLSMRRLRRERERKRSEFASDAANINLKLARVPVFREENTRRGQRKRKTIIRTRFSSLHESSLIVRQKRNAEAPLRSVLLARAHRNKMLIKSVRPSVRSFVRAIDDAAANNHGFPHYSVFSLPMLRELATPDSL